MNDSETARREKIQASISKSAEVNGAIRYDSHFARIVELIKGKTFSREEIHYLLEVLNSRVDDDLVEKILNSDAEQVATFRETQTTPIEEKHHHVFGRTIGGTFSETTDISVGVGASPIDIARAFMAGRTSEHSSMAGRTSEHVHSLYSYTPKGEATQPINKCTQQLMPSSLPRPTVCWPGAMADDHMMCRSHNCGILCRNFPGTPYSRTIASKSPTKGKLRYDSVGGYGSVGPIRRVRNKLASKVLPRGSMILSGPRETPSEKLRSNALSGSPGTTITNMEPVETSGFSKGLSNDNACGFADRDAPTTDPSASQAIKKILEHLDKTKPEVEEKQAELTLSTLRGKSPPSEFSATMHGKFISSSPYIDHKPDNKGLVGLNVPVKSHDTEINFAANARGTNLSASRSVYADSGMALSSNSVPALGLERYSVPAVKKSNEEKNSHSPSSQMSNGRDMKGVPNSSVMELPNNHRNKNSLPSIFINKPIFCATSSETNPSFSFPISTPGVLLEPPTPSFIPFSASKLAEPSSTPPVVPSYSFATNKSNSTIVFSFPSTSNTSVDDTQPDLKFGFRSDKRIRFSFSSFECH